MEFSEGLKNIKVVAFDADDTLWENEPLFREAERKCWELISEYGSLDEISAELYKTEAENMSSLGYGFKPFVISIIETAIRVSKGKISTDKIQKMIDIGKTLANNPATPMNGVTQALEKIANSGKYRLIVLTKGDLLDQRTKIFRSGLMKYFDDYVVVHDKSDEVYRELLKKENIRPQELLMVGNSFKSDIDPILKLGGMAIYVPFRITWEHEKTTEYTHANLVKLETISRISDLIL